MGLGTNPKRVFLKLKDGKVVVSDGRVADFIEGHVTDVHTSVRTFNGEDVEMVNLTFTTDGEDFVLGMNKGTGLTRGLLNMLCAADALGVVRVTPYVKDGWQRVAVTSDGEQLHWKYPLPAPDDRAALVDAMVTELKGKVTSATTSRRRQAPKAPRPPVPLEDRDEHRQGEPAGLPF